MTTQQIANSIPHEYREKILLHWLPNAKVTMSDPNYKNLFQAYYVYVDPNGIPKDDCPICLNNIFKNWQRLEAELVKAEQEYNLIDDL